MPLFTIYWSHPLEGDGSFTIEAVNADSAIELAVDSLASALYDADEIEMDMFIDDLTCEAYEGACLTKPSGKPAAELT